MTFLFLQFFLFILLCWILGLLAGEILRRWRGPIQNPNREEALIQGARLQAELDILEQQQQAPPTAVQHQSVQDDLSSRLED